jgi:hypothetical protein
MKAGMTTKRRVFYSALIAVLLFDVLIHFSHEWQTVKNAEYPPSGLDLVRFLVWNTVAGSIEIFTSPVGVLVILILLVWFALTLNPKPPKPPTSPKRDAPP